MSYTLGTAAKATGKSKTTIMRAIRKGKISAEKNTHGQWDIDPAELHRVYPEVTKGNGSHAEYETTSNTELQYKINLLERDLQAAAEKNRQQEESIGDLKDQRDRLRQDVQDWKEQAQRKRLTWRGLFGGGKAGDM